MDRALDFWFLLGDRFGHALFSLGRIMLVLARLALIYVPLLLLGALLLELGYTQEGNPALFDAVSAFIGGTLFMGETCSAFTAGVMAAGLRHGEIENSIPRVVRLLAIMTVGGNAFDERLNKFNASMNWGYSLSKWMRKEFGSTQCRAITGCDFATMEGVGKYVEEGKVERCREVVEGVAGRVREG